MEGSELPQLNRFNKARLALQGWFNQPIDWDPLHGIAPNCSSTQGVAFWKVREIFR